MVHTQNSRTKNKRKLGKFLDQFGHAYLESGSNFKPLILPTICSQTLVLKKNKPHGTDTAAK